MLRTAFIGTGLRWNGSSDDATSASSDPGLALLVNALVPAFRQHDGARCSWPPQLRGLAAGAPAAAIAALDHM
eukprot:12461822-Alexandrium_andersonii.AAC.1